jgi:hypothetical protein
VNVIYLKGRSKLYLVLNTPPVRLLNAKQLEQVNKYLNSPKRLLEKRRDLDEQRKRDAVERSKNLSNSGKTISKDWQSSYEHARKGSKKKTTKRRL